MLNYLKKDWIKFKQESTLITLLKGRKHRIKTFRGVVQYVQYVNRYYAVVDFRGNKTVFDIHSDDPLVIRRGDDIIVSGLKLDNGRFCCYQYYNYGREVFGGETGSVLQGTLLVFVGLFFAWAIFPLFIHFRAGLQIMYENSLKRLSREHLLDNI